MCLPHNSITDARQETPPVSHPLSSIEIMDLTRDEDNENDNTSSVAFFTNRLKNDEQTSSSTKVSSKRPLEPIDLTGEDHSHYKKQKASNASYTLTAGGWMKHI
jgi:hypothetical protein